MKKLTLIFGAMIIAGAVGGYVANVMKMIDMVGFSGLLAARIAGVFIPPLGAALGFF